MNGLLAGLSRYALPLLMLCAGALIGLCLAFPLFSWKLPDLIANLLAGAVGSIGTVAGAFLVLKKQLADAKDVARESAEAERQKEEARKKSIRWAISNALYADLKSAFLVILRSREVADDQVNKLDDRGRSMWIQRFALLQLPSFDRFHNAVGAFGDDLAAVLLHVYGEISRVSALCRGQQTTNNNPADNADFITAFRPGLDVFRSNILRAMKDLYPFTNFENEAPPDQLEKLSTQPSPS